MGMSGIGVGGIILLLFLIIILILIGLVIRAIFQMRNALREMTKTLSAIRHLLEVENNKQNL